MAYVLIDGDIVAYRAAASYEGGHSGDPYEKADQITQGILDDCSFYADVDAHHMFMSGTTNFRKAIAKTKVYKGNRNPKAKPESLSSVKTYLVDRYDGEFSVDQEADDLIGIYATMYGPADSIIASIDKDMLQIPAYHYNIVSGSFQKVTDSEGTKFFYTQLLTGDPADNIPGVQGVGPKKADKILEGLEDEYEMYEACLNAYQGDLEFLIENAQLLWLRREEGQMWQPPVKLGDF